MTSTTKKKELEKMCQGDTHLLYEMLYKILIEETMTIEEAIKCIEKKEIGLNEKSFHTFKSLQDEKDEFLDNPFDVTEGVIDCPKCFKKKTFSYSKQVRSSDEGFSTFNLCLECSHKWRIN